MVSKTVIILAFVGACLAIPVEEVREPVEAPVAGPLYGPGPLVQQGEQIPLEVNPEETDLKTDASRWWRRRWKSFYPTYPIYRRYYYNYPSIYSYHYPSHAYWNSYW